MKRLLKLILLLLIAFGVPYLLARTGVIPVAKWTSRNPALAKWARTLGLSPRPKVVKADSHPSPKEATPPPTVSPPSPPPSAPPRHSVSASTNRSDADEVNRRIGWVAKVYENMEPEEAVRILERLNDREVVALLRRMRQRQVAQILALFPPERAARLSRQLMIQR